MAIRNSVFVTLKKEEYQSFLDGWESDVLAEMDRCRADALALKRGSSPGTARDLPSQDETEGVEDENDEYVENEGEGDDESVEEGDDESMEKEGDNESVEQGDELVNRASSQHWNESATERNKREGLMDNALGLDADVVNNKVDHEGDDNGFSYANETVDALELNPAAEGNNPLQYSDDDEQCEIVAV
eukprot:CAMPEP_0116837448 /NCGR_PEP_ID=MMETSP0418-20121206/8658_1 /TAXON_ID=1158023 /ORGANISM="Astrosyne radiata, Strain 13vi08-1A" /LENGTH=187 /DNA_ID=CAMNT_0004467331 /DNA_START=296 /DNA_END=859 /DNA_ORIENTATION=+